MATTSASTIPYLFKHTIFQGTAWDGVRFRKVDANGDPITLTVHAPVSTAQLGIGGEHLLDATVSSADGDGFYTVYLTAAQTTSLPIRQLYIDIYASHASEDPAMVLQGVLDVTGTLDD